MLFSAKPCLPYFEQARIEFHLQQIAECIGADKMLLPVLQPETSFAENGVTIPLEQILKNLGKHLQYDVSSVGITSFAKELNVCGGGG